MSQGEDTFALHLRAHKIPFERQYKYVPERKFTADFFIEPDILCEIEGGVWRKGGGAHSHPSNIERDIEKGNLATIYGYRLFRFMPDKHVDSGLAIEMIQRALSKETK